MFVDVLRENVGDTLTMLSPFKYGTIEVIFVEVTGENIDGFILLQERWYDTIQVQPVVEYQDGLLCFQYKAAMEYIGQRHYLLLLFNDIRPLGPVVIVGILLMHLVQLAIDLTFKCLNCVEPVLWNRAKLATLKTKAAVCDGSDQYPEVRAC